MSGSISIFFLTLKNIDRSNKIKPRSSSKLDGLSINSLTSRLIGLS